MCEEGVRDAYINGDIQSVMVIDEMKEKSTIISNKSKYINQTRQAGEKKTKK